MYFTNQACTTPTNLQIMNRVYNIVIVSNMATWVKAMEIFSFAAKIE